MELNKMGYEKLIDVANQFDAYVNDIKEIVEKYNCVCLYADSNDENNLIYVLSNHQIIASIDLDTTTLNVIHPEMIFRGRFSSMFSELADTLLLIKELLEDDWTTTDTFIQVKSKFICDKAIQNISSLIRRDMTQLKFIDFIGTVLKGLTSQEITDIEQTFIVSDNLYPLSVYAKLDSDVIIDSIENIHDGYEFNYMLGVWVHTGKEEAEEFRFMMKRYHNAPYIVRFTPNNTEIKYIHDDVDEDSIFNDLEVK